MKAVVVMGLQRTQKGTVYLFFVIYLFVLISHSNSTMSARDRVKSLSIGRSASNALSAEEHFGQVMTDYHNRLSLVKKPVYQDHGHAQYGPPIPSKLHYGLRPNVKRILLWTECFGRKQWLPEVVCAGHVNTCVTSVDKNDILKSDGVLFHARDMTALPSDRLPGQRWIYFVQESPHATGINVEYYNGVFNWTATYRLDSDIPSVYYKSGPLKKPMSDSQYKKQYTNIIASKNKLAVGAISNCDDTETNRIQFIQELKQYVSVDFYGACGDLSCPKDVNCIESFSKHKFYLSFENTNCRDYITEKVYLPLHVLNSVPVVMGGAHPDDYLKVMPPNSFIHYQGFASAKELADFLTFLDRNDDMYERYHRWRRTYGLSDIDKWCDLCQALHNTSLPSKIYTDFKGWYGQDTCKVNYLVFYIKCLLLILSVVSLTIVSRFTNVFYRVLLSGRNLRWRCRFLQKI